MSDRCVRAALALIVLVSLAVGCAADAKVDSPAAPTAEAELSPDDSVESAGSVEAPDLMQTVSALQEVDVLRFSALVSLRAPDLETTSFLRQGQYSRGAGVGTGTESIGSFSLSDSEHRSFAEDDVHGLIERERVRPSDMVEYRLLGDELWTRAIEDGVAVWTATLDDLSSVPLIEPRAAVDGREYLAILFEDAFVDQEPVGDLLPTGAVRFQVRFDADVVAPLTAGDGLYEKALQLGFSGETGLVLPGSVDVTQGQDLYVEIDMWPWWAEAVRLAGTTATIDEDDGTGITFRALFEPAPAGVTVEPPCADPEFYAGALKTTKTCPCPLGSFDPDLQAAGPRRQMLVVTTQIPGGTPVDALLDDPSAHLSARLVPTTAACRTSISSIAELQEYSGAAFVSDVATDVFLDQRHFGPVPGD